MLVLRRYAAWRTLVVPLVAALLLTACPAADEDPTITVGSFNFPESVILAEIYAQALDAAGYPVETQLDLGARELIFPSIEAGDISLLPEYIGSSLSVGFGGEPTGDVDETTDAEEQQGQRQADCDGDGDGDKRRRPTGELVEGQQSFAHGSPFHSSNGR
jgi:glycine betaine/choline ABC-type transport system substrate-binding protein